MDKKLTKEEIIKKLLDEKCSNYDSIKNALIKFGSLDYSIIDVKIVIEERLNQAYNAGFESCKEKVEEGVKKQLVRERKSANSPGAACGPLETIRTEKYISVKTSLESVLTTIREIKP